jgi:16S rRNA (adenine1518-N6/adenine1519-N6)-dimethyltransferase
MPARLGQHFLIDEGVRDAIVAAADVRPGERVLEIGPGRGMLTGPLLRRAREVLAVEMDDVLAPALPARMGELAARLRLVHADFLKLDLTELGEGPFKLVANLPYSVATPILQKVLPWPGWTSAVLMFQKEVAERIAAASGDGRYGMLTLSVLVFAEPELLLEVPRESFAPRPKIASAVVRLTRRAAPLLGERERELFFRVARAAFGERRKMAAGPLSRALGLDRGKVARALESAGLKPTCRAEEIPFAAFLKLPGALGL